MKEKIKKSSQEDLLSFESPRPSALLFFGVVIVLLLMLGGFFGSRYVSALQKGSGKMVSEDRPVDSFSQLHINGDIQVKIAKGDTESVSITAEDNVVPDVKTLEDNDALTVTYAVSRLNLLQARPTKDIVVTVVVKNLKNITVDGAATLTCKVVPSADLEVSHNGSGNINIGLNPKKLTITVTGEGSATMNGSADSIKATVSGSGSLNIKNLSSPKVSVATSGSGDIMTQVTDTLTATISGSGSISYSGNPKTVNKKISGSGTLKKL